MFPVPGRGQSVIPLDLFPVLHVCVRVVVHYQFSARSGKMLILESLSITHQRLRVPLSPALYSSMSLSVSLSVSPLFVFLSLRIVVLESCVI